MKVSIFIMKPLACGVGRSAGSLAVMNRLFVMKNGLSVEILGKALLIYLPLFRNLCPNSQAILRYVQI